MPHFDPSDAAVWTGGRWSGAPAPGRRIVHDSRAVKPGDWFVALRGERTDGHDYLPDVFARGAAAAIVERGRGSARSGPCLETESPRAALTAMARGHRRTLRGRIIGITGSVGKSTIKEMVAAVLSRAGCVCRNPGNWNNDLGVPLSLLAMNPDDDWGVFELGMNHPGELRDLCDLLQPHWGIMGRIGPAHIEFFPDESAVADEKSALVAALPEDGLAIAACDEPWFERIAARARSRLVRVALDREADYRGQWEPASSRLRVTRPGEAAFEYAVPFPGEHMARNALRAIAAGREAGLSKEDIAAGLCDARLPPMRWMMVNRSGVCWVNDAYNCSPDSLSAALRLFASSPPADRRWVALGGMRELGAHSVDYHRAAGREAAAGPWAGLVCVGERARDIAMGAEQAGYPADRIFRCDTPEEAAHILEMRVRAGDAVLLKGSRGERMEQILEHGQPPANAPASPRPPM
ncbi:MAG: UDP-N-acetylmuramoyl-tripeptide--D-alanyl-D-alanine ligase [Kiritimatiellae bacterium]|nr:UDP-N-acetylmuramoyl-tripeptide--D-alanyl-D-alanine ligase [Kiritimatiellia bacterium]